MPVQLNEYETDPYFLQNFQCTTMLIHTFCKIFEHEIVFVLIFRTGRTISDSQFVQNTKYVNQQRIGHLVLAQRIKEIRIGLICFLAVKQNIVLYCSQLFQRSKIL